MSPHSLLFSDFWTVSHWTSAGSAGLPSRTPYFLTLFKYYGTEKTTKHINFDPKAELANQDISAVGIRQAGGERKWADPIVTIFKRNQFQFSILSQPRQ